MAKIIKTQEYSIYKCDFCEYTSNYIRISTCEVCGRHFCSNHGNWEYDGDYKINVYCDECNEIYKQYISEIESIKEAFKIIEDKYYDELDKIKNEWKAKALGHARNKTDI